MAGPSVNPGWPASTAGGRKASRTHPGSWPHWRLSAGPAPCPIGIGITVVIVVIVAVAAGPG